MALNDTTVPLSLLKDPINVQDLVLTDVEARYNGIYTIVDPNNVAIHLIEMSSTLTANFAASAEDGLSAINALRAQSTEDLARNMSDYDYVNTYSTPATTTILLTLDKKYIVENAISDNDNYLKVVIPKDTVITIAGYTFGMFYPVEIKINKTTGMCVATFDSTVSNPLYDLTQNLIPTLEETLYGTTLLILKIPMYQFSRSYISEDLTPALGFANKYSYLDKFYAVRIFTTVNNETIELAQTLSPTIYDPYTVTARIRIDSETNQLYVNIPQVYFDANMLGTKLLLEVYVCKGTLDLDISGINSSTITCNFNLSSTSSEYSKILSLIPTVIVSPANDKITGGSNGLTFEELRTRVINNSFHTSVLVTPTDLAKYFDDAGFRIVRYKDNLTNLIYFGYKTLTDNSANIIPSMTAPIALTIDAYKTVSTIKKSNNNTYTVLPKTLYKYDSDTQSCIPVPDTELLILDQMSKQDLITEFNDNTYTKSPFHIRLIPDGRYPKVASYNLMTPTITDLHFIQENVNLVSEMVATGANIYHQNEGSGGYKIQFLVNKSDDIKAIDESLIHVYLYTESDDTMLIGQELTLVGTLNTAYIYEAVISTDYDISRTHKLNMTSLLDDTTQWSHYIPLSGKFYLVFMVETSALNNPVTESSLYVGVTSSLKNKCAVMVRQSCTITFGYSLEDVVYNDIDIRWSGRKYATHPIDVPMTYSSDVYEVDANGVATFELDQTTCKAILTPIHKKGDIIVDDFGNTVYLYRKGDIRYDTGGSPILLSDRALLYYVNTLMIDAKIYISEHPTQITYRTNLPVVLESYFSTLRTALELLLERDELYFRPIKTIGNASFNVGNGIVTTMPLNLSIKLKCFVSSSVISNTTLTTTIEESIASLIEPAIANRSISLTDIAKLIKANIDYIDSVDVLGINGDTELQTITIGDESVQPSVEQKLYLTKDKQIALKRSIDIEFVTIS